MTTGLTAALDYHVVNSLGWPDLRPLQRDAVEPVRRGDDCLLLAPTAGGKTEAACFPLLSEMVDESWTGLSILYVTPLRALLNNLHPRLSSYAAWLGRTVGLWHGDVGAGERRRLLVDPPDILLTTPESLEAMLVSTKVDHRHQFAGLRVVVVDELHAFAGDDRGWHLLSVLERLQRLAGHRVQRIGLSATVGNPADLLTWLQGGTPAPRATVVAPDSTGVGTPEVTLDYVGSVDNAATVVASLHQGDKRLVFCDSRAQAESLASGLRGRGVTTFVSHSSLSAEERRRSELAFAEARDCVVVATSTLELGIDVGDLDRVIQLDAPRTVASFLQRLGRTGRRAETSRNTLFLATRDQSLLQAAGLLSLWSSGFVEPVVPPPSPRHIVAQQLLAVTLQEGRLGASTWPEWWPNAPWMSEGPEIMAYLRQEGFLARDGDLLFIGDEAERRFGRRHFMDLTAVFTAEPELKVLLGRRELGSVSPLALTTKRNPGERTTLLLAGRSWVVTAVDWRRRIVNVAEDERGGRSLWQGGGVPLGFELAQAMRSVLLGTDPPVEVSRRSRAALERIRTSDAVQVTSDGTVVLRDAAASVWWTWAGTRANASLAAALEAQGLAVASSGTSVRVKGVLGVDHIRGAAELLASPDAPGPALDHAAIEGLRFSAALPPALAAATLGQRLTDPRTAQTVASGPCTLV
jgi:ATP-dependent Lhr-like helicase